MYLGEMLMTKILIFKIEDFSFFLNVTLAPFFVHKKGEETNFEELKELKILPPILKVVF
jgi:hypothetical protein